MVLSVCQRVLQNPHDAHDAFQATFLVLVRKAASIRRRESVGGWLFGIARESRSGHAWTRPGVGVDSRKLGLDRQNSAGDEMAIDQPRARIRPADRRDRTIARAVSSPRRPSLFRGLEHRGDGPAAGLCPGHRAFAASPGPRAATAAPRAPVAFRSSHSCRPSRPGDDRSRMRPCHRRSLKKRFAPPDAWPWPERRSKALSRPTVVGPLERRGPQSDVRQGPACVDPSCPRHGGSAQSAFRWRRRSTTSPGTRTRIRRAASRPGESARARVVAECQPEVQWRARSSQRSGARRRRQTRRRSPDLSWGCRLPDRATGQHPGPWVSPVRTVALRSRSPGDITGRCGPRRPERHRARRLRPGARPRLDRTRPSDRRIRSHAPASSRRCCHRRPDPWP